MKITALSFAFLVQLLVCSSPFAADWYSCAEELDRLRRAAGDAEDAARDVDAKAEQHEQCKLLPIMDIWNDGCRTTAAGYRNELSNLERELDQVKMRIQSASSLCAAPASTLISPTSAR